jgi:ferredoxin
LKTVAFSHNGKLVEVKTQANVLQVLLAEHVPVSMACGGRGMCATCHVYIERGLDALTPKAKKEERTLSLLAEATPASRLACQAKILKDGVVVRLPSGLYVEKSKDLYDLVGRRAESRLLHPVDGRVLVPEGKIITRSTVDKLTNIDVDVKRMLDDSKNVSTV